MGEAFIAQADNPSATAYNPAGLTQLEGTQIAMEGLITNSWTRHISPLGEKAHNVDEWQIIPAVFITSDLGTENIVTGLGITVPNGISSRWSASGFARYVVVYTKLTVIDINPVVSFKINDCLSIGGGVSYYYSNSVSECKVDYGSLIGLSGQLDGMTKMEATGDAWGYNAGVLCKLNEKHSIAATFKSPFKINYKGNAKLSNIASFMGLGPSFESDLETSMKFPAVTVFGYAYRPFEKLKLEFNLDWTRWKPIESVTVDFDSPALTDADYAYDYMDTLAYKFGTEYSATENFQLRAGYIYNENATPEANWRPSLPDSDTHFVCSGFGWRIGRFTIDGAVQAIFYNDRTIDNNVDNNETSTCSSIDGEYKTFALGFSLGATYKF